MCDLYRRLYDIYLKLNETTQAILKYCNIDLVTSYRAIRQKIKHILMLCKNQFTNMETNQRVMQIPVHMELKMENRKNKTVKIILRKQDTIGLIY